MSHILHCVCSNITNSIKKSIETKIQKQLYGFSGIKVTFKKKIISDTQGFYERRNPIAPFCHKCFPYLSAVMHIELRIRNSVYIYGTDPWRSCVHNLNQLICHKTLMCLLFSIYVWQFRPLMKYSLVVRDLIIHLTSKQNFFYFC